MKVITSLDVRVLDRNSEAMGVKTELLMENAGRSVVDAVERKLGSLHGKTVVIFAGPGGNGGDGLTAARHFAGRGAHVTVYLLARPDELRGDATRMQYSIVELMDMSVDLKMVRDELDLPEAVEADVIVDALLGVGIRGRLRTLYLKAIKTINSSRGFKVAIDVPSGMDSDTGEILGDAVKADMTVTLHAAKPGLLKRPEYAGEIVVADIGIPPEAEIYVGPGDVEFRVPRKKWFSHKGDNGVVLVVAGSEEFPGAPRLTALAALRAGVDLVLMACPERAADAAAAYSPDLIPIKLAGTHLAPQHLEKIGKLMQKAHAIAIGPGVGLREETEEAVAEVVSKAIELGKLVVADADALKHLSKHKDLLRENVIITPHAGEFRIMFGTAVPDEVEARIKLVEERAKAHGNVTILLKGPIDIISDGRVTKLNKCHSPAMTVGGTGDTLTGIVAAMLAKGLKPVYAAALGAFINGLAGCIAYAEKGDSMTASDIINYIPRALTNTLEEFKKTLVYRRLPRKLKR